MSGPDLSSELAAARLTVDRALAGLLKGQGGVPPRLRDAMRHSLLGPGKRLRPILLLWTYDAVGGRRGPRAAPPGTSRSASRAAASRQAAMQAACALEFLHTYSLIHDDLPAMDDDTLRRGRPTCHVLFGEATAILAGDALQAAGFGLLARAGGSACGPLVALVAEAVGPAGMVGGQQDDLSAEGGAATSREILLIHRRKTAALVGACVHAGALLAGAPAALQQEIRRAGIDLGLAFQGADDLLDDSGDAAALGKSPGKDAASLKATFVRSEGRQAAARRTARHGLAGSRRLQRVLPAGPATDRLLALAGFMWRRDR